MDLIKDLSPELKRGIQMLNTSFIINL